LWKDPGKGELYWKDSTFKVVSALNGMKHQVSLKSLNYPHYYLRHADYYGYIHRCSNDNGCKKDASWIVEHGFEESRSCEKTVSFQSANKRSHYLRHQGDRVKISRHSNSELYREDASWVYHEVSCKTNFLYTNHLDDRQTPKGYWLSKDHCIRGHVYKSFSYKSLKQCSSECDGVKGCKSFNWRPIYGCNCDIALVNRVDDFKSYKNCVNDGWNYYEKMTFKSNLGIASFSISSLSGSNWMKGLDGSKKLSVFSIPGTHDSAARGHSLEWVNCQDWSIFSQLKNGVRFFDMRVKLKNEHWVMVHGEYELGFNFEHDMLDPIYRFLDLYPSECIIMRIQRDSGGSVGFNETFAKYVNKKRNRWLLQSNIPTLNMCRGKIFTLTSKWKPPSGIKVRKWKSEKVQDEWELEDDWRRRRRWGFIKKIGKAVKRAAKKVATVTKHAPKKVAHGTKHAAKAVASVAKHVARGRGTKNAANAIADVVEDGAKWFEGGWKEDLYKLGSTAMKHVGTQFLAIVDDVHGVLKSVDLVNGKDAASKKLKHILSFHYESLFKNFDSNFLHINHWSYFEYTRLKVPHLIPRLKVPQLIRETARTTRKMEPQLIRETARTMGKMDGQVKVPQLIRETARTMRKMDIIPQLEGSNVGICVFDFPSKFQLEQVFCRNYGTRNGNCFKL